MEWSAQQTRLSDSAQQFKIWQDDMFLSHGDVHHLWQTNPAFASFYSSTILESGFESLCWETPPVTLSNLSEDHEFVVVESPMLMASHPDPSPFQEHFFGLQKKVVSFPNLGRNGIMIVPVPPTEGAQYGHLASFLANAPSEEIAALWRVTSEEIQANLDEKPKWLSTAGLGVSWLHIRIDTRPKYYRHNAYRESSQPR